MAGSKGEFFVYVGNHANKVSVLRMARDSGALTKVQEVQIQEKQGRHMAFTISPDKRFLYVASRTVPYSIHTFAIDGRDGTLEHLHVSPTVDSATVIVTDRTGRFLLGAHNPPDRQRRTGFLTVTPISEQGIVLSPTQVLHTPPKIHSIATDPSNRYAFAPSCDGDLVLRFKFDVNTGLLDPDGMAPLYVRPKSGARHHRYHPNGRFLYINNEYDGTIYCYRYDATNGSVAEIQIADARPAQMDKEANVRISELRFTPDGKWAFSGSRGSGCIVTFSVNPETGRLTRVGECEVSKDPRGFNLDPFGTYLVHSADLANELVTYRIDAQSGGLTKVAQLASEGPNIVEIIRLP